jgi:hypothetical protein
MNDHFDIDVLNKRIADLQQHEKRLHDLRTKAYTTLARLHTFLKRGRPTFSENENKILIYLVNMGLDGELSRNNVCCFVETVSLNMRMLSNSDMAEQNGECVVFTNVRAIERILDTTRVG